MIHSLCRSIPSPKTSTLIVLLQQLSVVLALIGQVTMTVGQPMLQASQGRDALAACPCEARARSDAGCCCTDPKTSTSCCAPAAALDRHSCCSGAEADAPETVHSVLRIVTGSCRGMPTAEVDLPSLPMTIPADGASVAIPVGERADRTLESKRITDFAEKPPIPPPRRADAIETMTLVSQSAGSRQSDDW